MGIGGNLVLGGEKYIAAGCLISIAYLLRYWGYEMREVINGVPKPKTDL
jgi:hypothetical protein